jgi:hypothetical protein
MKSTLKAIRAGQRVLRQDALAFLLHHLLDGGEKRPGFFFKDLGGGFLKIFHAAAQRSSGRGIGIQQIALPVQEEDDQRQFVHQALEDSGIVHNARPLIVWRQLQKVI